MDFGGFGLNPLVTAALERMSIKVPTEIQQRSIPLVMEGRDLLALAPTGTGKTLSFLAPICSRLLDNPPPKAARKRVNPAQRLRAVVICPTRELARQTDTVARDLVGQTVLKTCLVHGKTGILQQREQLESGCDILIGTPGRILELVTGGDLSLANVRDVVIDEGDRMFDMGFAPQVRNILKRIPPGRRIMLFSATLPPHVESMIDRFQEEPARVGMHAHSRAADHLELAIYRVPDPSRMALLLWLLMGPASRRNERPVRRRVLVFTRTRRRAGWVAQALRSNGINVGLIHGDRSQAQRQRALDEFAAGRTQVLVSTDLAARGLHIATARTVINYDLPLAPEEYVHRVGRAGHGGDHGEAFTFIGDREQPRWERIVAMTGEEPPESPLPDLTGWLRPADLLRLEQSRTRRSHEENEETEQRGRSRKTDRSEKRSGGSGKDPSKYRRPRRSRPIGKNQKPGTGVRRPDGS